MSTCYNARHDKQFDSSLDDLDIHSRLQGHRKASTGTVIVLGEWVGRRFGWVGWPVAPR